MCLIVIVNLLYFYEYRGTGGFSENIIYLGSKIAIYAVNLIYI